MNVCHYRIVLMSCFFLLMLAASSGNAHTQKDATPINPIASYEATQLPSFLIQDVNGNLVNFSSFAGKKIFLNLWASWCPPCQKELPSIEKLYRSVNKEQVAFVLLALDDDFEKSKKYMQSKGLNLPIYYPAQGLPPALQVKDIPVTFIFNENSELMGKVIGGDDYDTDSYRRLFGSR